MRDDEKSIRIAKAFRDGKPILDAIRRATRDAHRRHKMAGVPIIVIKDGKTLIIPPEKIDINENPDVDE